MPLQDQDVNLPLSHLALLKLDPVQNNTHCTGTQDTISNASSLRYLTLTAHLNIPDFNQLGSIYGNNTELKVSKPQYNYQIIKIIV